MGGVTAGGGASLKITPGFNSPAGSNNSLTARITAKASSPYSRRRKGAMLRPVPCSALSEPSYLPTRVPQRRSSAPRSAPPRPGAKTTG